ncbi:hypothetical protein D3C72_1190510 [compost metagenome]
MRRRRRGVVLQPVQGVVHALRGERRQRLGLAFLAAPGAIDDGVVRHRQVRHVEQVAQGALERLQVLAFDIGAFGKGEMQGNGGIGFTDLDRHPVVPQKLADLLDQVVPEQRGLGDGGLVDAGFGHMAVREPGVDRVVGFHHDADGRIVGAGPFAAVAGALQDLAERRPQECGVARIDLHQPVHRGLRILEGFEGQGVRPVHGRQRVYCVHH